MLKWCLTTISRGSSHFQLEYATEEVPSFTEGRVQVHMLRNNHWILGLLTGWSCSEFCIYHFSVSLSVLSSLTIPISAWYKS